MGAGWQMGPDRTTARPRRKQGAWIGRPTSAEGLRMAVYRRFRPPYPMPARCSLVSLLPSGLCSLKHTLSASARIETAQPFRICRYTLPIVTNYFIARSTRH
jgi:hypothetical protein